MKEKPKTPADDPEEEIVALVGRLLDAQRRLSELTGGEVDSVLDSTGKTFLLRDAQEKLRTSETTQRTFASVQASILNALPAHIALLDQEGVIVSVNERWERSAEHEGRECLVAGVGKNYLDCCEGEQGECAGEARAVATGIRSVLSGALKAYSLDYFCETPTGQRWFRLRASPVGDRAGAVVMLVDITEYNVAEEALRKSRERLAFATSSAKIGIWEYDLVRGTLLWDRQMYELYGVPAETSEGAYQFWQKGLHPEDRERAEGALADAIEGQGEFHTQFRVLQPSGAIRHLEAHGLVQRGEDGSPLRMTGVNWDVTERKLAEAALAASELRHRSLFENMLAGYCYCRLLYEEGKARDYVYVEVNPAFERQTRLKDVVGKRVSDVIPGIHEANPEQLEVYIRVAATGKPERFETYTKVLGLWFSVSVYSNEKDHFAVVFDDISGRKRAEKRLRASEERHRKTSEQLTKVLDSSLDAICSFDIEGRFLQVSAACEQIWGYRADELIGTPYIEKVMAEDRARTLESAASIMAGNPTRSFENRYTRKDGSTADMLWSARWSDSDKIMYCVARDNTVRKKEQRRLVEQAALIDEAHDAIVVRDLKQRITFWNRGAERLYGWSAEEVLGKAANELLKVDIVQWAEADRALRDTGEWKGEFRHTARDGTVRTLDCRWTLLRDDDGEPVSFLSIDADITDRKKIELQFLRAQRMESVGTLAGGIAHDLNNVLGPILMALELLKMRFPEAEAGGLIDIIAESARRGSDMVKQVLTFARGVEGQRLELRVTDLISDVTKIAHDTFLKTIDVRTTLPDNLWSVLGDPTQLHQVLLNLCVNARDAMPEGGTLSLSAENVEIDEHYVGLNTEAQPGPHVAIQVEDTGIGIPPEVMLKIFEPFFTTKELTKGTGLGLSTTIAIVKSHGGFVRVYSEPGRGSKFRVYLPASTKASNPSKSVLEPELPRGNGELILIVDDEASVRSITQQTLEAFGYGAVLACEGAEAISLCATRGMEIAAVLTDMMMPGIDGAALVQVLHKLRPHLPIIVATGLTTDGQISRVKDLGVKHFLAKPYRAESLLKALKTALQKEGGES
jgi:PAS domain S-box-containing protein